MPASKKIKHLIADKRAQSFFEEAGQHLLVTGATGSGKSTLTYWLIKRLVDERRNEIVIFRDTGKSSESLYLSNFKPLRYLVPEGCDIISPNNTIDFEVCEFSSFNELFDQINSDKINIISVRRFLLDPFQRTDWWALFFEELTDRGLAYELPTPLTVVIDELSQVAPSGKHSYDPKQKRLCAFVAQSVELLRGVDIRLIGTSQGWTKLFKGVRISFQHYIFKRVAERVDIDIPVLKNSLNIIQSLRPDQFVWVVPEKYYSNPYSGLPDLKIKQFCQPHKLRYRNRMPYSWRCESELRPEIEDKDRYKKLLEGTKRLVKHMYENEIITQQQIAEIVGNDTSTINRWLNDSD